MDRIVKTELIEVNFGASTPTNLQQIKIGDIAQLRNKDIYAIEAYSAGDVALSPSGQTMIVDDDLPKIALTLLNTQNREILKQFSSRSLNPRSNGGLVRALYPLVVNWVDTYITILDNTGLGANESICFNVHYKE